VTPRGIHIPPGIRLATTTQDVALWLEARLELDGGLLRCMCHYRARALGGVKRYHLGTTGACKGHPDIGRRASLLTHDDLPGFRMPQLGSITYTTTNRMERMAVIKGVKSIPAGGEVKSVSDSPDVITVAARRQTKQ
jgi:hypothetical protein